MRLARALRLIVLAVLVSVFVDQTCLAEASLPGAANVAARVCTGPAEVARQTAGVFVCGDVNSGTLGSLSSIVRRFDNIYITSNGGDPAAAVEIGKLFLKQEVSIVVDRYCNNECAFDMFLPAKSKVVRSGALVLFSPPQNAIYNLTVTGVASSDKSRVAHLAAAESALLAKAGIDGQMISCISRAGFPDLSLVRVTRAGEGTKILVKPGRYEVVALSPSLLGAFGVRGLQGYWYPTAKEQIGIQRESARRIGWITMSPRTRRCQAG